MRTDRDTTRIVRSWLEEGRTALPDYILDAVLDQVPATRQRRSWWPAWRFADMNTYAKLAIGVAAVVVVLILGINLLPVRDGGAGGGPVTSPSPSPSLSPSPSPDVPAASPRPAVNGTTLESGTYRLAEPAFTRVPFTFTVPDGWRREEGNFISKGPLTDAFEGDGVTMAPWIVTHVYGDPCQWEGTLRETSTVDELTAALAEQPGHTTTGPTATTVGGRPATQFEFSVPADFDAGTCQSGLIRLWPDAGPDERYGWPIAVGQTVTVYVVDVDGQAQLIVTGRTATSSAADVAELSQVVDSIQFE
jgi:hypothetical protein